MFVFANADGLVGVAVVGVDMIRDDWSVVVLVVSSGDDNEDLEWETSVGTLGDGEPGWESVDLLWFDDVVWALGVGGILNVVEDFVD